jgi:hypothetical protein
VSASICWEPCPDKIAKSINVDAPSLFQTVMREAGMELPITLDGAHYPELRAMAAVFGNRADVPNPYQQLIDLIDKHERVHVWAEY